MIISGRERKSIGEGSAAIFANSASDGGNSSDSSEILSLQDHISVINRLRNSPLAFATEEARDIERILSIEETRVFLDSEATEANLKALDFRRTRIIHFASHGYIDLSDPNWSAIILAAEKDDQDDGLLQPEEMRELPLRTKFVFLSACQTGIGISYPGEGVINLARPFLIAGSEAVIVTRWNINDRATTQFVKYFYESYRETDSAVLALAAAKRMMLQSERKLYRHPYYWAGFTMVGR